MFRRALLAAFVIVLLGGVLYSTSRPGFEEIPPNQAAAAVVTTGAPTTVAPTTTELPTTTVPETTTTTVYVPPTTAYVAPPTTQAYVPPTTVWVEPEPEPEYIEPDYSSGACGGDLPPCYVMMRESGGDPTAQNPTSTASGKWQFLDSTWQNYSGYAKARYAPEWVQDEKARQLWAGGAGCAHWSAC